MMRLAALLLLSALFSRAASVEVWLTPERARQLKAVSSRPYVTKQVRIDGKTSVYHWTNGSREWATTQAVSRITGAKARNPHADAKREAAEARAAKDALLKDIDALGKKAKVTPAEIKAVAEKHAHSAPRR
jgi:hypothetical protein